MKACIHLAYAYFKAFPNLKPEFPRNNGEYIGTVVPAEKQNGLLYHYQVKRSKIDAMGFPTAEFERALQDMLASDPLTGKAFWDKLRNWFKNQ